MKNCRCFPVLALAFVLNLAGSFPVAPIPPILTSIVPSNTLAGGATLSLTLYGTDFYDGSIVQWNGVNVPTTYINSTQLTAMISAIEIASARIVTITVFNPLPGGGTSNPLPLVLSNPTPALYGLTPDSATAGGSPFTLTVTGTNFVPSSTVQWNSSRRPTTFISSGQLTALISAVDITSAGPASVTVFNSGPGGGMSSSSSFSIKPPDNPVPMITYINPNSAATGDGLLYLNVFGGGFISSSTVQWNGNNRNTTFVSSTQLSAVVYAGDIATTGTASISVSNPAPGGGISNRLAFAIRGNATPPSATGTVAPSSIKAGGTVLVVVRVTPGTNPASTGLSVSADLASIGGPANQMLYDDGTHGDVKAGDGSFSFRAIVSANTPGGTKTLPVVVKDARDRSATTTIQLTVLR